MADETQDIPLSPAGVEAAHHSFIEAAYDEGGYNEGGELHGIKDAIRAYLPHHQPAPVPPVTAEDVQDIRERLAFLPEHRGADNGEVRVAIKVATLRRILAVLTARATPTLTREQEYRRALESIAANTCCDGCREAARVATAALAVAPTDATTREGA